MTSPLAPFPVLSAALLVALVALGIGMLLCGVRLWRGPSLPDRIVALDTLYLYALALVMVIGIVSHTSVFFEAALLIAMLGFVSTIAAARYLARGDVIE